MIVYRLKSRGCTVVPGFVDPHTHVVYAGDRRGELQRRLAGATYAEIAAAGGGIVATVDATRRASQQSLVEQSLPRLDEMLRCGTTTCEVKSGYGLDLDAEIRMLRAVADLRARQPIDLVATFMGAREVPVEYRSRRREYIDQVVHRMIPRVADEGLAAWCDVFCETGVYTADESEAILRAGIAHRLAARIHADELGSSGGDSGVVIKVGYTESWDLDIGISNWDQNKENYLFLNNTNHVYTETETKQPEGFVLYQNYPNPFNPSTKISWQSPIGSWQTIKVYDVLGNEVCNYCR